MQKTTEIWTGIRYTSQMYETMLNKVCKVHHLTGAEADILAFLFHNPQKDTAADITQLRRISKATVSKAVESLIRKSLIERNPDQNDRRKIHLKLLRASRPVIADILHVQKEFWQNIFTGFSQEELDQYMEFNRRIFENAYRKTQGREEHESE